VKLNLINRINYLVKNIKEELIKVRRKLHEYPELGLEEKNTAQIINKRLKYLEGIKIHSNYANTPAIVVEIEGKISGPTRALRADMDALPIEENTNLPFSSKVPGKMHACGHDVHTAVLLGVAVILSQLKNEIKGKIVLIFQPGEEGRNGAKILINNGVIEEFNIKTIFGYHLWPELPLGTFGVRSGPITNQSDWVDIEIKGESTHGAKPHKGVDPIIIASYLLLAYQELLSRELPPSENTVFSFGKFHSGSLRNIIPDKAFLEGIVRTPSVENQKYIERRIKEIFEGIICTFRATGKLNYKHRTPFVFNEPQLFSKIIKWAEEFWSKENVIYLNNPLTVADDFAHYTCKIPAFYGLLGIGGKHELHSSSLIVDESVLVPATGWATYLALKSGELNF